MTREFDLQQPSNAAVEFAHVARTAVEVGECPAISTELRHVQFQGAQVSFDRQADSVSPHADATSRSAVDLATIWRQMIRGAFDLRSFFCANSYRTCRFIRSAAARIVDVLPWRSHQSKSPLTEIVVDAGMPELACVVLQAPLALSFSAVGRQCFGYVSARISIGRDQNKCRRENSSRPSATGGTFHVTVINNDLAYYARRRSVGSCGRISSTPFWSWNCQIWSGGRAGPSSIFRARLMPTPVAVGSSLVSIQPAITPSVTRPAHG